MAIEDVTEHLGLPLPHPSNDLSEDVYRLRDALSQLDIIVASKAGEDELNAAIAAVVGAAPDAMNSLKELAQSLGDNPDFAGYVATQINAINGTITAIQLAVTANSQALAAKADLDAFNVEVQARADGDTTLAKADRSERQKSRFRSAR